VALVVELVVEGVVEVEEAGVVEDVDTDVLDDCSTELLVLVVELVAEVELVVGDDEVEDVVVVKLEELEVLELEAVRATYAPMPATAIMMTIIATTTVRAIPTLSRSKKK
jgi:hypothetical protein